MNRLIDGGNVLMELKVASAVQRSGTPLSIMGPSAPLAFMAARCNELKIGLPGNPSHHSGLRLLFAPDYEPIGIPLVYNGEDVVLPPEAATPAALSVTVHAAHALIRFLAFYQNQCLTVRVGPGRNCVLLDLS